MSRDRPSRWGFVRRDLKYDRGIPLLRSLWGDLVLGQYRERCGDCCRLVAEVWYADNELWNAVMGEPGWEERAGECAYLGVPGTLCRRCFKAKAKARGIRVATRMVRDEDYSLFHQLENAESWKDVGERSSKRYWEINGSPEIVEALLVQRDRYGEAAKSCNAAIYSRDTA